MNILHLTSTDPAGSVINFVNAINRHTGHRARAITTHRMEEFEFPADVHWIFDAGDEIEALLEQADVLHLHKVDTDFTIEINMPKSGICRKFNVGELLKKFPNKKVVYHVHGHPYERGNVEENAANYRQLGGKVLCSTPDMEQMYKPHYDGVEYFPNCVPVDDVLYLPRPTDKLIPGADGVERFVVCQTPTHTVLKNCHVIEQAVKNISSEFPVIYDKVWGMPQHFALRRKRNCHVAFDHLEGYYGMSSLESLSMGKPTIAGLSDYTAEAIKKFFSTDWLPWVDVKPTQEDVEQYLKVLLRDNEARAKVGAESRKFMKEVWSDKAIAQRLAALYGSL
jgi:glycosyltransferase involved in cell wall biosynthesis